jgi:hypothetical protein
MHCSVVDLVPQPDPDPEDFMILGLPDPHPDPLVTSIDTGPDPASDPQAKIVKNLDFCCFVTSL